MLSVSFGEDRQRMVKRLELVVMVMVMVYMVGE